MMKTVDDVKKLYLMYRRLNKLNVKDEQEYVFEEKEQVNRYGEEEQLCKD